MKTRRTITLCCVLVVLSMVCGIMAYSAEKSLTFAWDQVISTDFAGWRLWVSDTAGGPYDDGATYFRDANGDPIDSIWIAYDGSGAGSYTSDQVVTIPDGQSVTLYFVLNAWDTANNYSQNSNEVSQDFVDAVPPDAPQSFSVTIIVGP